mmetsp:Transcript_88517/g.258717  ORF Transcript_88517/g.258717 Transcript_88517/m.258717 type:complete len:214 (-) Transcript_88517:2269-2910(-)
MLGTPEKQLPHIGIAEAEWKQLPKNEADRAEAADPAYLGGDPAAPGSRQPTPAPVVHLAHLLARQAADAGLLPGFAHLASHAPRLRRPSHKGIEDHIEEDDMAVLRLHRIKATDQVIRCHTALGAEWLREASKGAADHLWHEDQGKIGPVHLVQDAKVCDQVSQVWRGSSRAALWLLDEVLNVLQCSCLYLRMHAGHLMEQTVHVTVHLDGAI